MQCQRWQESDADSQHVAAMAHKTKRHSANSMRLFLQSKKQRKPAKTYFFHLFPSFSHFFPTQPLRQPKNYLTNPADPLLVRWSHWPGTPTQTPGLSQGRHFDFRHWSGAVLKRCLLWLRWSICRVFSTWAQGIPSTWKNKHIGVFGLRFGTQVMKFKKKLTSETKPLLLWDSFKRQCYKS